MGIIRMTLLTVGALGVGMMHFGRDEGLSADRLGREPTIAQDTIVPVSADLDPAPTSQMAQGEVIATANAAVAPTTPDITPTDARLSVVPVTLASASEPQSPAELAEAAARAMATAAPEVEIVTDVAVSDVAGDIIYVSGKRVNLRAGPSTGHGIVASLTRGTAVIDMGESEGWRQIKVVDTGARGFMSSQFLSPSL